MTLLHIYRSRVTFDFSKAKWNAESTQDLRFDLGVMKAAGAKNKDQTAREEGQPDGKVRGSRVDAFSLPLV